eukprot:scaffold520290_cov38-Prasinocladus_malaysianus.AAC.1
MQATMVVRDRACLLASGLPLDSHRLDNGRKDVGVGMSEVGSWKLEPSATQTGEFVGRAPPSPRTRTINRFPTKIWKLNNAIL